MYPSKKPLRFVKIVVFLRAVTSEILHEISPFALFLVKKQEKKTRCTRVLLRLKNPVTW